MLLFTGIISHVLLYAMYSYLHKIVINFTCDRSQKHNDVDLNWKWLRILEFKLSAEIQFPYHICQPSVCDKHT